MGREKEMMIEMEEADWEETSVSFTCPSCKDSVEGSVELPIVYDGGFEHYFPISIVCCECGSRYEGSVHTDWDNCEIELDDYPNIIVEAESVRGSAHDHDDDYYEWLERQERTSRPVYQAFAKTISDIKTMTADVSESQQSQMLARMLLAQSITSLEVFLADTLILTVTNSKIAQEKLLKSKTLEIGKGQFKLADAIGIEDFSKEKLLEYLRSISFHNLEKVTKLFQIGLGISILPDGEELTSIQTSIHLRHDCIHRNGVHKDTGKVCQIDQALLMNLIEILERTVMRIDEEVEDFDSDN